MVSMFTQLSNSLRPPFYLCEWIGERKRESRLQGCWRWARSFSNEKSMHAMQQHSAPPLPFFLSIAYALQLVLIWELQLWKHKRACRIVPALCISSKYFCPSCKVLSPPAQSTESCNIKFAHFFPSKAKRKYCCYFVGLVFLLKKPVPSALTS